MAVAAAARTARQDARSRMVAGRDTVDRGLISGYAEYGMDGVVGQFVSAAEEF